MVVTEAAKHDLYTCLQESMGDERATTLMAMLPPTGWEDVATKQDLALLRTEMHAEFKLVRTEFKGEMGELRADFERGLRTQLHAIYVFNGIFLSLAVGVARLLT